MHNVAAMPTSFPTRAVTALIDCAAEPARSAFVACYVRSLDPRTEAEFALATAMAEARWRMTCLWELEAFVVNREIHRLKSLNSTTGSITFIARALSSLTDPRQTLDVIDFLESRYHRQYIRARARLRQLRRKAAQQLNFSKQTEPKIGNLPMPSSITAHPGRRLMPDSFL